MIDTHSHYVHHKTLWIMTYVILLKSQASRAQSEVILHYYNMPSTRPLVQETNEARSGYESDISSKTSLASDALDDEPTRQGRRKRRRGATSTQAKSTKAASKETASTSSRGKRQGGHGSPAKKKYKTQAKNDDDEVVDVDLKDGQEIVGKVVQAPQTGWGSKGQISQHTLDFLAQLRDPSCNDRGWFKLHEPVYRRCEKEFKEFIEAFSEMLVSVDPQIPPLPPKDVVHRIYRDIRFSNDKTPYKTGLSASFSRSGRKGIFAFFKPGDESIIAAGTWCPGRDELLSIRNHILHSPDRLREILSDPEFMANFGKPQPHPDGKRQSVFGHEDELKTAPKGVDKHHKDIDLLKCRSLAVSRTFTDEQVLNSDFIEQLKSVVRVLRPFVHCLNDMITLPVEDESDSNEDQND
ncbi:hypothetical protein EDC04DRAFT_2678669 [Pisolithus marmoratus]|nr:hypothetical protein EDC04DRAFT_2678669 [Pisolithus marmoratus]